MSTTSSAGQIAGRKLFAPPGREEQKERCCCSFCLSNEPGRKVYDFIPRERDAGQAEKRRKAKGKRTRLEVATVGQQIVVFTRERLRKAMIYSMLSQ